MLKHREIYRQLLEPKHSEGLEALMKEQNVHESLGVKEFLFQEKENFPYILLKIEVDQVFAAQMVGLRLDIQSILPEYSDQYYFPVIAMGDSYDPEIEILINEENSIQHELIHIKDVLTLIEEDPTYLPRLSQYSIQILESVEDLPESIDLEVFKIFHLEPPALKSDFKNGERVIRTMLLGQMLQYECNTQQEYVEMQIHDYLQNISGVSKEKFSIEEERIEEYIESSVKRYGQKIFGENPVQKFKELKESYPTKMLGEMMKGNFKVNGKPLMPPIENQPKIDRNDSSAKISRNAPCPCGSGKKYKKCCAKKE